ncbi:MAG: bifunctional 4-hydroxy-3-methylbut-2-enyl diphosphate reductase/30S ribosomal protein S1 [Ruminococcaceae bacterium]|nr:bifunctional 4-hydroxy-3-methylbut-2-enyl diphosphate reductase/30S ribosomal protein S1 [Oscillospiraceae bacterium]
MKQVIVAKSAGFCAGVAHSVALAERELSAGTPLWCLGELIHNRDEVARLCAMGMRVADTVEEIPEGSAVLLRSHGVGKAVYDALERRRCRIIDGTCGRVKYIHRIADRAQAEGKSLIVFGQADHPEVQGICGWCADSSVAQSVEELECLLHKCSELNNRGTVVVFQSTETQEHLKKSKEIQKKICTNAEFFDTICDATQIRQSEALDFGQKCDAVVVIGGKHSANSRHLVEICAEVCDKVLFVENAAELALSPLAALDTVGITAGASVPGRIIKEVEQKMCDEINQTVEVNEAAAVEETAAVETEKSFEELLEDSIKTIYNGETVKGIVAAITPTEVTVDLGTKHSGYIPVEDFADENGTKIEDLIHIGDEVEACVVRVNDVEGTVMLSKRRLDAVKNWEDVERACEDETVVEGVVTEENKGGIVVSVKGIRVFVPASQSGLPRDAEMSQLLKQKVQLRITEVNKGRRRVVGSIRAVTAKARREAIAKIWDEIEIGKRYDGVVKSLTSYGAFVDIGGVDGMVHVSELSWKRISKPADVVSVGDKINVYVINFDKETHKISLGYKDPNENPWSKFMEQYKVGDIAPVTVVKLMTFGAFAEVVPGVDGLIHISQIANRRIGQPGEVLTVGDVVDAKITAIDEEKHKVSLSIRALCEPAPAAPKAAQETEEEEEAVAPEADALVYEVSETGESTGIAPEDTEE